ncbi:Uu.00g021900.m01.CDS01 [Anthostomella pinea]|uniref:Uu.00g021900.m01.CDS01 n=1 Tax=Anthostomella pinea TaxID=933095 RepID=A0AAI8VZS2_9PEZI|nr:Uu.00g021900.m01.CDS01 [Anthostomella pinea]
MSFGPQVVMPAAFHLGTSNATSSHSGVHAGIFRPPMSPSVSSSVYMGRSTGSLRSDASTTTPNVKRKRTTAWDSTPRSDRSMRNDGHSNMESEFDDPSERGRRMDGEERRYTLAGQIETPSGEVQREIGNMEDSVYSDVDYRRALGSKRPHGELDSPQSRLSTTGNSASQIPRNTAWGSLAINTLGGVVGKVWQFCRDGAFRGFYAGGGKGCEMQGRTGSATTSNSQVWCNEHDVPTLPDNKFGSFPQSDYSPFYYEHETPESTPPPAAKRRQINDGTPRDELRRNWVMVKEPEDNRSQSSFAPRPSSSQQLQRPTAPPLTRRISKPVSRLNVPTLNRHHSGRISHAGSASLSSRTSASFASPRSPVTATSPSRLPIPSRPQSPSTFSPTRLSQQPSRIPSPSLYSKGHRRAHSAATAPLVAPVKMRKRESMQEMHDSSPRLDAEARKLAAKRLQEEMDADLRINDFNSRLKDMIRQGKEALGTTIEVELDGEGERGFDPWEDD